jgi:hypothetical protein
MRRRLNISWLAVLTIGFLAAACSAAGQVAPSGSTGPAPTSSAPAAPSPMPTVSSTASSSPITSTKAHPTFSEAGTPKQGVAGVPRENDPVVFEEVGLPGGQAVSYSLTAEASASYQCWNRVTGEIEPQKETVKRRVTTTATLTAGSDGKIQSMLQLQLPLPDRLSCSMGFQAAAYTGTYGHVLLADTTNDVRVDLGTHEFIAG